MIYVTGDKHGDFTKLEAFRERFGDFTREDYVIVAGDFGLLWDKATLDRDLKMLAELPFTVLFVDGNHENFDMLDAYPIEEWKGGKIHRISSNVIHLMRGQIFEIEGKRILAFGGAESPDRYRRREGIDLWIQEEVSQDDVDEAVKNLDRYGRKVDYVISHSCSTRTLQYNAYKFLSYGAGTSPHQECSFIGTVENYIQDYKHWYFGHFHFNCNLDGRHTVLYNDFIALE